MVSPSKKQKVERRIRTGPSPANSSATPGSRKNKASNSKPLADRRFYLDIKNNASLKKTSERLVSLGGKLELFLGKEVDYVVTDRENFPLKKRSPLDQVPTPSPLPSFCSVSPATTDSPTDGLGNKKTRSRAEAMLERVKQQPQKTTGDVLDNAISWKIPIYPLSKFVTWLERFSNRTNETFKDQNTGVNSPTGRNVKVLTGSYLKIETGVRPEFRQFNAWPSLGILHRPVPLAAAPTAASNQEKLENKTHSTAKKDLNSNEQSQRMTRKVGRVKEASSAVGGGNGYCEICRVYYDQLDNHTISAQHLKLVTDSAQYSQLDSIIQQNNLGSNSLRKSLRIAKSPPPFMPPEMGGKHSSGSGTAPSVDVGRDVTRGLRLKECSVALGPPSPLLNGHATPISLKPPRSSNKQSLSQASPSQTVINGCVGRRSQRSQPLLEIVTERESNDVTLNTPVKDRNLRSRKASSAQTPMTTPPPERLPSPPPDKPSPPHLRSGTSSEKAVTRSGRSHVKSEDGGPSTRSSVERLAPQMFARPEKSMMTRSRERSIDPEARKSSPAKSSERHSRLHDRLRSRVKGESEEDDPKRIRKEDASEEPEDRREERRRRREERTACSSRIEEDRETSDETKTAKDKWNTSHDRPHRSERSLRVKDRPYYEEPESEESPPAFPSRVSRTPKSVHRKKRTSSKSRVTKKRLSVEEKLIEDNKSYYKVEVLNSKLRSTEYFVNQKQAEERVNGDMTVEEVKPVVVRFKKIRTTELALLSDEAESFMFGETKKEDSDEDEEASQSSARLKEETTEGSSEPHTSIKAETDSSSHSDLIPVKGPSSDDVHQKVKEDEPEEDDDEPIEEDVNKLTYAFEKPPAKEPWLDALVRQKEGTEHYIPMHHDYPKVVLPYQVKRRKRRTRKSASSPAAAPTPSSTTTVPSSPFHRKDRVSRLIQASVDEKPRKSPRRLISVKKGLIGSGPVSSDVKSINPCEESNEPQERCHASTLAIMSSLMRRRPHRECADKLISYEEESSLPETIESSGSNSNSMDVKIQPSCSEPSRVPPTVDLDLDLPPGGDRIAEALLNGLTHLDNYEPASCLQVDPSCIKDDVPAPSQPGLYMSVEDILGTFSDCTSMNLEENLYPIRPFPSFSRGQADSYASSDCSDFLGFMDDGQMATKKRKKRRNLTGWPIEKPRKKNKDLGGCLLSRPVTPEPAHLTSAAVTPLSASSPLRRRGRPSKIRPCLSATLAIPTSADDPPQTPTSPRPTSPYDYSALPIKKKICRFGSRRSVFK